MPALCLSIKTPLMNKVTSGLDKYNLSSYAVYLPRNACRFAEMSGFRQEKTRMSCCSVVSYPMVALMCVNPAVCTPPPQTLSGHRVVHDNRIIPSLPTGKPQTVPVWQDIGRHALRHAPSLYRTWVQVLAPAYRPAAGDLSRNPVGQTVLHYDRSALSIFFRKTSWSSGPLF